MKAVNKRTPFLVTFLETIPEFVTPDFIIVHITDEFVFQVKEKKKLFSTCKKDKDFKGITFKFSLPCAEISVDLVDKISDELGSSISKITHQFVDFENGDEQIKLISDRRKHLAIDQVELLSNGKWRIYIMGPRDEYLHGSAELPAYIFK